MVDRNSANGLNGHQYLTGLGTDRAPGETSTDSVQA